MARNRDDGDDRISDKSRPRGRRDDEDDDRPRRRDDDEDDRPRRRGNDGDDDSLSRDQVRTVARSQKVIILCILAQLLTIPIRFIPLPPELALVALIVLIVFYLAIAVTATVFVFMLTVTLYSTGIGVLLGFLTFIPCIGLLVLLFINAKATGILKQRGIRVGLLGANMSDVP